MDSVAPSSLWGRDEVGLGVYGHHRRQLWYPGRSS